MIFFGGVSSTKHAEIGELHLGGIGDCSQGVAGPAVLHSPHGLVMGLSHEQVAALLGVNEDSVSRWVRHFNDQGIDGLPESPPRTREERTDEYRKLVLHTELVNETHWTGRKFHGYLTTHCQLEAGYSTLMRWLHDEGFRLKVPRPWHDGQDEEKRKAFIELIRKFLGDR